jgi:hypothetical protein
VFEPRTAHPTNCPMEEAIKLEKPTRRRLRGLRPWPGGGVLLAWKAEARLARLRSEPGLQQRAIRTLDQSLKGVVRTQHCQPDADRGPGLHLDKSRSCLL